MITVADHDVGSAGLDSAYRYINWRGLVLSGKSAFWRHPYSYRNDLNDESFGPDANHPIRRLSMAYRIKSAVVRNRSLSRSRLR